MRFENYGVEAGWDVGWFGTGGVQLRLLAGHLWLPLLLASFWLPTTVRGEYGFSTRAGAPGQAGSLNGAGGSARFNEPAGIVVAGDGTLYVADAANHVIRRIVRAGTAWNVATLAGSPGSRGSSDGTNAAARFYFPYG
ncbi:MAG TPA: hypothetical protein VJA21_03985, partial [Verrucomicrobiae bacterium]